MFKRTREKIEQLEERVNSAFTHINGKLDRDAMDEVIRKEKYEECFNCGVLANKNKMKPLAVFEKDVYEATPEREMVLNGYVMRMAMNALGGSEKIRDNKSTTIYFCKNCKAELPKN